MFSGITAISTPITKIIDQNGNLDITITKPVDWQFEIGESVLVDGICSTVVEQSLESFAVTYMAETRSKTHINNQKVGDRLNLERSLRLNDILSGHLVTGHVDTTGTVITIQVDPGSTTLTFSFPTEFSHYLVNKGSITVNGVSLTVIDPTDTHFKVSLIPHTLQVTNLDSLQKGDAVNLEFDIFAKYIEKMVRPSMVE
jgi:riboflavin synthase